jgi:ParD-like antitoxin of type II bacterial toxin-antitoxin system
MSTLVKINNDLYELAKLAAKNERRTVAQQIEFWVKVERTVIDNPDLPTPFIADALASLSERRVEKKPEYKLEELLAQWSPSMRRSKEDDEWLEMRPVGKEIW